VSVMMCVVGKYDTGRCLPLRGTRVLVARRASFDSGVPPQMRRRARIRPAPKNQDQNQNQNRSYFRVDVKKTLNQLWATIGE
jgi:hypothetical protein